MGDSGQFSVEEFQKKVDESAVPCFVDFYADWCGPCKAMRPVIDLIRQLFEEKHGVLKVIEVDVDKSEELAKHFDVRSVPTYIMFKDGKKAWRVYSIDSRLAKKIGEELLGPDWESL